MNQYLSKLVDNALAFGENLPFAPLILFPVNLSKDSEYSRVVKEAIPDNEVPYPVGNFTHSDRWFYVNGICSNRYVWYIQALKISGIIGKTIEPLFNPTHTFLVDVAEVLAGRILQRGEECTQAFVETITPILESGQEVHVIGYSQGGILVSNMVRALVNNGVDTSKLHIYTFASAHEDFVFDNVFSEHFANGADYVSRSGVLRYKAGNAPIYKLAGATGHFLNSHYLDNFKAGKYCGGVSKLYSYVVK